MPLSLSWKMHFLTSLDPLSAFGDRHVVKYTEVMDIQANVNTKMKYLNNDHNLILVTTTNKQVTLLHNLKNYGSTFFNPVNKVAALIGMGLEAAVIKLDTGTTTTGLCACTPTIAEIFAFQTTNALRALPPPNENRLVNFKGLKMVVPNLFLCNAVLEAMTSCPFALVIVASEEIRP